MKLVTINHESAAALADILSNDEVLNRQMGDQAELPDITPDEYYWTTRQWEKKHDGRVYAIIEQKMVLGVLSYLPLSDTTATVGYWIRSDQWNLGFATRALRLFKKVAAGKGFHYITANVPRDNPAALAIWQKNQIILTESRDYFHPWMELTK
ncbi:MAG TPA: GNAT family N-acetyltransferase [Tissierellia bacterium]|nr:GNAT family N-acetyltransferase [Tissierellia bacterium]